MSPAAFEAVNCFCLSRLLDMKHGALERHFDSGVDTFIRGEPCDMKLQSAAIVRAANFIFIGRVSARVFDETSPCRILIQLFSNLE